MLKSSLRKFYTKYLKIFLMLIVKIAKNFLMKYYSHIILIIIYVNLWK
jgi:hypothetical protein